MRYLDIAYLLQSTDQPWGGVLTVLREADALTGMGHRVTVYSTTHLPDWHRPAFEFIEVKDFDPRRIDCHDLIVGTLYTTVPAALVSGRGRPVHYCQGYEGDAHRLAGDLLFIESVYQRQELHHITVAPFLARRLEQRFGWRSSVVPYGIDTDHFRPAAARREPSTSSRLRVALVGPWDIEWKGIPIGVAAARAAFDRGIDLELVRIDPTPQSPREPAAWGALPVEWHQQVAQSEMPALYQGCDLFLGTTLGGAESFFMPAMEAMACGVPAVLSDVPCFGDYESDEEFAVMVPPGDVDALAAAICRLATAPELRRTLRDRGLALSQRHTFARHVDAMHRVFQELVPPGAARSEGSAPYDPHEALPGGRFACIETVERLLHHARGDLGDAERSALLDAVLVLEPESIAAWHARARLRLTLDDRAGTHEAIEHCLRLDPRSMGARRLRGLLSLTERRFADAVADLTAAIDGGHPGPNVHLELALALLGGGAAGADISGADAALQRALAIQLFDRRSDALLAQIDRAVERIESAAAPAPVITLPRPERAGTPDPARRS